jgi:hypothetical protein
MRDDDVRVVHPYSGMKEGQWMAGTLSVTNACTYVRTVTAAICARSNRECPLPSSEQLHTETVCH